MKNTAAIGILMLMLGSLVSGAEFIDTVQSQTLSTNIDYTGDFELNLEKFFKENVTLSYSLDSQTKFCQINGGFLDKNSTVITVNRQMGTNEIIARKGDNIYIFSLQGNLSQRSVSISSYSIQRNQSPYLITQKSPTFSVNITDSYLLKALTVGNVILLFGQFEYLAFEEVAENLTYILSGNVTTNSTISDAVPYMNSGFLIVTDSALIIQNFTARGSSISFSNFSHYNSPIESEANQTFQIVGCDDMVYFLANGNTLSIISINPRTSNVSVLGKVTFNSTIKQIQLAQRSLIVLTKTGLWQYVIMDSCADLQLAATVSPSYFNTANLDAFSIISGSHEDKYFCFFDQSSQKLYNLKHSLINADTSGFETLSLADSMLQATKRENRNDSLLENIEYVWLTKTRLNFMHINYTSATLICVISQERTPSEVLPDLLSVRGIGRFCSPTIYNFTSFTSQFSNQSNVTYTNNVFYNPRKPCTRDGSIQLKAKILTPDNQQTGVNKIDKKTLLIALGIALGIVLIVVLCILLCRKLDGYVEELDEEEQPQGKFAPHLRYEVQEDPPTDVSNVQNATNLTMIGQNGQNTQKGQNNVTSPSAVILTTSNSVTMQKYQKKKGLTIKIPKI